MEEVPQEAPVNKKKLLEFGVIEIGIVAFVIVAILVILGFMNVLPFNINPFASKLPINKETGQPIGKALHPDEPILGQSPTPAIDKNIVPVIEVVNNYPGYTLAVANKDSLATLLKSWGVFGGFLPDSNGNPINTKPLKTLKIVLSGTPQKGVLLSKPDKSPYLTYSIAASGDTATLTFNATQEALDNTNITTNESRGAYATTAVLSVMYRILHNNKDEIATREAALQKILQVENKSNFFTITKL